MTSIFQSSPQLVSSSFPANHASTPTVSPSSQSSSHDEVPDLVTTSPEVSYRVESVPHEDSLVVASPTLVPTPCDAKGSDELAAPNPAFAAPENDAMHTENDEFAAPNYMMPCMLKIMLLYKLMLGHNTQRLGAAE
ncbi:hypothetical protein V6N13_016892 [Hibiscus sabdariffa]|uniref:Uncharacterized protein n=1 Tax=Hibiscus sabdariffa TaxID=183260 RepID=A0ABR2PUC6_9ROSI